MYCLNAKSRLCGIFTAHRKCDQAVVADYQAFAMAKVLSEGQTNPALLKGGGGGARRRGNIYFFFTHP